MEICEIRVKKIARCLLSLYRQYAKETNPKHGSPIMWVRNRDVFSLFSPYEATNFISLLLKEELKRNNLSVIEPFGVFFARPRVSGEVIGIVRSIKKKSVELHSIKHLSLTLKLKKDMKRLYKFHSIDFDYKDDRK